VVNFFLAKLSRLTCATLTRDSLVFAGKHAFAQEELGRRYATGESVPQDLAAAAKWFRKAADQGNVVAQMRLGAMYSTGQGVRQNYAEALKWLRLAADQGNVTAQALLGGMYAMGMGVEKDYAEGARWIRAHAEPGPADPTRSSSMR
jgi:TPR repeat protein